MIGGLFLKMRYERYVVLTPTLPRKKQKGMFTDRPGKVGESPQEF